MKKTDSEKFRRIPGFPAYPACVYKLWETCEWARELFTPTSQSFYMYRGINLQAKQILRVQNEADFFCGFIPSYIVLCQR